MSKQYYSVEYVIAYRIHLENKIKTKIIG